MEASWYAPAGKNGITGRTSVLVCSSAGNFREYGFSLNSKHALKVQPARKRKYYPIVTVVVGTLLTVVPLLLLSLSLNRSICDPDIASVESCDDNLHSLLAARPTASKAPVAASTESKVTAVFADRSMTPAARLTAEPLAAPARPEPRQLSSRLPEVSVVLLGI